jgi:hypothetical protein
VIEGFIVDFYCDAVKLAIEVDGKPHEEQGEYDELREEVIARQGVRVLRIPNDALHDIEAVIEHIKERIAEFCAERGNLTPNPFPCGKGNNRFREVGCSPATQPLTPSHMGRGTIDLGDKLNGESLG